MNYILPEEDEDALLSRYFEKSSLEDSLENLFQNSEFFSYYDAIKQSETNMTVMFFPEKMLLHDLYFISI